MKVNFKTKLWITLTSPLLAFSLMSAASAHSHLGNYDAYSVQQFPDSAEVRLVKHHNRLFAFVADSADVLKLYTANRKGTNWHEVTVESASAENLLAQTNSVDTFGIFQNKVYAGTVNTSGVAEVWSICNHCRPAVWEQSGDTGLGDEGNTAIVDFFTIPDQGLYAITENTNGNGLFVTEDGEIWTQVGEYGLGNQISDAVSAGRVLIVGDVVNLATAAGIVYQASAADLISWTAVQTFTGNITTMSGRFVAVATDGLVSVYESDGNNGFSLVGEADLGNQANDAVVRFINTSHRPELLVANATDGAAYYKYNRKTTVWRGLVTGGFGNANNTSVMDAVHFHGRVFVSTVNATDGSEIYRISR